MTGFLRRWWLADTWALVAPGRSRRPHASDGHAVPRQRRCPFCEGNEGDTEPELFALRPAGSLPNAPGWSLRVVPNKYPALGAPGVSPASAMPLYDEFPAVGFHEVIVDTPDHGRWLGELPLPQLEMVLGVYRSRVRMLGSRPGVRSVLLFRNDGEAAGASQDHPHSQILAMPLVPSRLEHEIADAVRYRADHGSCLTCQVISFELAAERTLVAASDRFVAVASVSPRFPYETWILPRDHCHDFGRGGDCDAIDLAIVLKRVLCALESLIGRFAFNLVLQTAPPDLEHSAAAAFHWRLEVLPRLTVPSGLELGSDVFIVSVAPEDAARDLRLAVEALWPRGGPAPPGDVARARLRE